VRYLLLLIPLLALLPATVVANVSPSAPVFKLGFKLLADQVPHVVGQPLDNERWGDNGDSLQLTTNGLMVWRKADNWTAFTNGHTTWINGPYGVQSRPNHERFVWEKEDPSVAFAARLRSGVQVNDTGAPRLGMVEGFRSEAVNELGVTWERLVFAWDGIQPHGPAEFRADLYFPPEALQRELSTGREIVGLLQFTPGWAARDPQHGTRSVPKNLNLPAHDPNNYLAAYAGRMAAHYRGRINSWVIWNEPEFRPGDSGGGDSYSWMGSDQEYYLLLKRAYQAIKAANPEARVVFGATSYWVDVMNGRVPFFRRLLDIAAADPEAPSSGYFFDAVAFNLYWWPDSIYRAGVLVREHMREKGIDKPIWLTETNAMPGDDPTRGRPNDGNWVSMQGQADFAIQAIALASAAGFQRFSWYRMTDDAQDLWGVVRPDGTRRPVFDSLRTASALFAGAGRVSFLPLERSDEPFGTPWPADINCYYPNWMAYQVVFDHADGRRVTVLWNGTGASLGVAVPRKGGDAHLVARTGETRIVNAVGADYVVELPAATLRRQSDPRGYYYIGGPPQILVERGVPADAPVEALRVVR
jgi:hypothetical protein